MSYLSSPMLAASLRCLLLGTLALTACVIQPLPARAEGAIVAQRLPHHVVTLGVVQSSDHADQWQQITARLQATGNAYRVIDWSQVRRSIDLAGVDVLFLPNVETITSEQLLALQDWMGQGGRLIVSGAVGSRSQFGVREALQSLVGASWGFALAQPSTLALVPRAIPDWTQAGSSGQVTGGVLIPSGLSSQIAAVWQDAPAGQRLSPSGTGTATAAAIVVTERTTYLGWQWGSESSEFDRTWLAAAIARYGTVRSGGATGAAPTAPVAISPLQPQPLQPQLPQPQPAPTRPQLPQPQPVTVRAQPQPTSDSPTPDPAEQIAPAGLPVDASARSITTLESIAMRQELENLIGRFESALLAADSANSPSDLATVQPAQTASNDKSPELIASVTGTIPAAEPPRNPTVQAAQQILDDFPQLVAQGNYGAARQQWLQARRQLWDRFPTDRPTIQPEIRAIWLDRGSIVQAGSRQGLAQIFDRLAAAGINTVFFETVNAGYPIYPSRVAPQQNPLVRGWDPLAAAVELAHERHMELHAWVWTFAVGNRPHNALINQPADYPGPIIAAHPDWANYDNAGNLIPLGQSKPFLDPANPQVRQYLLQLFSEIVTRYDVDGLQLDYIRYPFQDPGAGRTYGYGLAARQQFQQLTGVDPIALTPSQPLWEQWTAFRIGQISSFVADASRILHQQRPNLILSTAVFPLSEHDRLQRIQQDWQTWARRGDVDLIVTMSYAMDTNSFLRLASPWLTTDIGSALVVPSIRLLNLPNATAIDQMQALRDLPASGYSLFAAENLNDTLQGVFDRTQGSTPANQPLPYRQPFLAAARRYDALEREWSFLLSNGQLWMRDPQLTQWRTQAAALSQALNELAAAPTPTHLQTARTRLQSFQTQFDDWMRLQSLNESYRVRTWDNRLTTLENLLNYGERILQQGRSTAITR